MTPDALPVDLLARVRHWRHDLHQIPETAFDEHATSAYVADVLRGLGYDVVTGIGGTGVVGTVTRGASGRSVGLRSELDALPITEQPGLGHTSRNEGTMHACGHDGHMAMLLGAAALLVEHGDLDGTVRAVFQPAEEPGLGAQAMVDDGLFDTFPVDRLFGIHNQPGAPVGLLRAGAGPVMASEDNFTIAVTGRGGHASAPHLVVDPLVIAAEIILSLQSIVARSVDPVSTAVLSCTGLVTDGARNAIPSHVTITGDTRSFDPAVQALLEQRLREVSAGVAAAHGGSVEVGYTHEFTPTVNDATAAAIAGRAAVRALGAGHVETSPQPMMASEDFGVLAQHVPACLAFLGNGTSHGRGGTPLHSHDYVFNDDALATGVAYYRALVLESLTTPDDPSGPAAPARPQPARRPSR